MGRGNNMKQNKSDSEPGLSVERRVFFLTKESFHDVMDYIEAYCRAAGCTDRALGQISVASSEILANIDSYAYSHGGEVEILMHCSGRRLTVVFRDSGPPFDPLDAAVPDVNAPVSERTPGGLGIFLVRRLMTAVSYQYTDGQNELTIEKEF